MPLQLDPAMGLDFWFSLAPLPWWEITKMVFTALLGVVGAIHAHRFSGLWRIPAVILPYVLVGIAVLHAMIIAHNDAVGRCLIVLQSIY